MHNITLLHVYYIQDIVILYDSYMSAFYWGVQNQVTPTWVWKIVTYNRSQLETWRAYYTTCAVAISHTKISAAQSRGTRGNLFAT